MVGKSSPVDILSLEVEAVGAIEASLNIGNLYQVSDGLYSLEYTNTEINRETSTVDDYELTLRPYDSDEDSLS